MIYADHAATSPLCSEALEKMLPFLKSEFGNPSSAYSFGNKTKHALNDARKTIAENIGALPEQIIFTSGGTESDNMILQSAVLSGKVDTIITSTIEHPAILETIKFLQQQSHIAVVYLPVDNYGFVSSDALRESLGKHPKALVSIMAANNELGTIEPIDEYASIAHEFGALFHTDAVQALGHVALDVQTLGIDYLSASAHKFNGPRGVGFVWMHSDSKLPPLIYGGGQESGLRSGTENVAGIVGMATALDFNQQQLLSNTHHLKLLTEHLCANLSACTEDIQFNTPFANALPGFVNVSFAHRNSESLIHLLDLKGICVSAGSACHSDNTTVSHVLRAIDLPEKYQKGTLRISLGYENTIEEVSTISEMIVWALHKMK